MRVVILLLSISSIFAFESPIYKQGDWRIRDESAQPQEQYFEGIFQTRIDHFEEQNENVTNFRYNVNANFFVSNGPLYIYLKDFDDSTTQWIESGLMVDVAKDTGAALITFDSRFFGRNRITSDASLENLQLLTIDQTLADIATFIVFIREYVGFEQYSTVILWGSGYGASLAVWARQRYPELVTAAYASSGTFVLQTYSFTPLDVLEYSLIPNLDCRDRVQQAYETLHELIRNGSGEYISNRFNLCTPIDTDDENDVAAFYEGSALALVSYMNQYHNYGINNFCLNMRAILADPLNSFARWVVHVYGDGSCYDHTFENVVNRSSNIEWDQEGTETGQRQKYYLQCTQLGGFSVADEYTWIPQDVSLDYHINKCSEVFGVPFNATVLAEAVHELYEEFEHSINNTLYTNGNIDIWRFFSRIYDEEGETINIDYQAKSADLPSLHLNDPYALYEAKREIDSLIREWSVRPETQSKI